MYMNVFFLGSLIIEKFFHLDIICGTVIKYTMCRNIKVEYLKLLTENHCAHPFCSQYHEKNVMMY